MIPGKEIGLSWYEPTWEKLLIICFQRCDLCKSFLYIYLFSLSFVLVHYKCHNLLYNECETAGTNQIWPPLVRDCCWFPASGEYLFYYQMTKCLICLVIFLFFCADMSCRAEEFDNNIIILTILITLFILQFSSESHAGT